MSTALRLHYSSSLKLLKYFGTVVRKFQDSNFRFFLGCLVTLDRSCTSGALCKFSNGLAAFCQQNSPVFKPSISLP